ncbi:MAG: hypothetical protein F9K44_03925 [Hyphomicrobiaceae bacterium]|nr:MAG: hypothetical protein F9K44_03925 [Hyphomicrobiaceae bacterium]
MEQAMSQWTPEQLVGVADHALKSDRVDDALNVYRYLTQNFPGTPQAEFAAGEIERLSSPASAEERAETNGRDPSARKPSSGRRDMSSISLNGHDPAPRPTSRRPRSERLSAEGHEPRRPEFAGPMHSIAVREGPAFVREYKVGTLLSRVIAALGWLVFVAAGLAALVGGTCIGLAYFGIWQPNHSILQQLMLYAIPNLGGALGGLAAIALGQAMRAFFDQANATRELLAIRQRY